MGSVNPRKSPTLVLLIDDPIPMVAGKITHPEIRKIVDEQLPIVICLQEMMTRITDHLVSNNYEWSICYRPESLGSGFTGLGNRKGVPYQTTENNSGLHASIAKIGIPWNVTVVQHNLSNQQLIGKLNHLLLTLEPPFLFCGDFNAAHEVWGSKKSKYRGGLMLEWAVDNDLLVLNDGSPTHYHNTTGSFTAIDVSFASNSLASKLLLHYEDTPTCE